MMTLIVTLCLVSNPTDCHPVRVPLFLAVTPQQCVVAAQTVMAENQKLWEDERVTRYTCKARG